MSLIRRNVIESVQRVLIAAMVVVVLAIVTLGVRAIWTWSRQERPDVVPLVTLEPGAAPTVMPPITPSGGDTPQLAPTSTGQEPICPTKIGIVAGHWQSDSGAVCNDGLQEVEINLAVAERVVSLLQRSGYDAEILAEFSPKLTGYQGIAVVSIHADSCNVPEATGFKVARVSASSVPELEDQLVACLIERYSKATGLQFHQNSITYDMTEYHMFYEIAPETPAAIIEIGFMAADRHLLTKKQDRVARGIVNGIKCFVSGTLAR